MRRKYPARRCHTTYFLSIGGSSTIQSHVHPCFFEFKVVAFFTILILIVVS
jgi:hypothetical protein